MFTLTCTNTLTPTHTHTHPPTHTYTHFKVGTVGKFEGAAHKSHSKGHETQNDPKKGYLANGQYDAFIPKIVSSNVELLGGFNCW